jgi:hypothetical protein
MGRAYSMHGKKRNLYRILVEKPERKKPLGRPRCRWEDNIAVDLREIGGGDMGWIDVARALVNAAMNFRFT